MSSMIRLLDNLTLIVLVDKDNKIDKGDSNRLIKKLAKFKKNIRNLSQFKNYKNSTKYKKLIKNLVKFQIFKRLNF